MLRSPLSESATPSVPDHTLQQKIWRGAYFEVWLARSLVGTLRAGKLVQRVNFGEAHPFKLEYKGIQRFEPGSRPLRLSCWQRKTLQSLIVFQPWNTP